VERAAQDRDDWTLLRVATPDRPGGLAVFARCMAACGVDILSIEILGHEGSKAVADVLVHGGDLDRALRALDEDLDLLGRRSHGDLPDPALAMAQACGLVFGDRTPAALLEAAMRLVSADLGAVYVVAGGALVEGAQTSAGLESLAQQALASRQPSFAEPAAGSSLAVVVGDSPALVLAVARDQTFPFQAAEVDRLQALGRLALPVLVSPVA
jgi:hypothetical protein